MDLNSQTVKVNILVEHSLEWSVMKDRRFNLLWVPSLVGSTGLTKLRNSGAERVTSRALRSFLRFYVGFSFVYCF